MRWIRISWTHVLLALMLLVTGFSIYIAISASKVANFIFLPSHQYSDLSDFGYDFVSVSGTLVSTSKDGIGSPLNHSGSHSPPLAASICTAVRRTL